MRNSIVIFFGGIFIGAAAMALIIYLCMPELKNEIRAQAIKEATYAIRQKIYDETNIRYELLDLDAMSDEQLLDYTYRRSIEFQKRFGTP